VANAGIGVKGWRNYSSFSLFAAGSQRADRQSSILVDTYSGNLSVLATDWVLAARVPCAITRAYNHLDSDPDPVPVDRPFGPGWYWQFDMNLIGNMAGDGDVTWKAADGSEYEFTYSGGIWTAPAGMHQCKLSYDGSGTPKKYTLKIGRMAYRFEVNTDDSRARLVLIEDAYGNALEIVRTYSNSMPTAVISSINIAYYGGSTPGPAIVTPTYSSGRISQLDLKYWDGDSSETAIKIYYTYNTIDGASRLTLVEPKDANDNSLNMELAYDYDSSAGLLLTKLYDSLGYQAGTPYYWQVTY
jgi:hypothetical protein